MFQPSHNHSCERVTLSRGLLVVGLSPSNGRVQVFLILESLNVLRTVRVDVLQTLGELVVESVHKADDAATDSQDTVLLLVRGSLGEFIVVGCDFLHGIMVVCSHDIDQLVDLLLSGNPKVDGHMRRHRGIIVEPSGYKRQKNPDLLIGGRRDLEQFFEDADLLTPVSVLDV